MIGFEIKQLFLYCVSYCKSLFYSLIEQNKKMFPAPKKALAFEKEEIRRFFSSFNRKNRYILVRAAFAAVAFNGCNRIAELYDILWEGKHLKNDTEKKIGVIGGKNFYVIIMNLPF